MMNDKIPNADNARLVLHSPFDIKVHKQTFINYLEVVISPEGIVEYAVPSHVEKLLQIFMSKYSFTDREKANDYLWEKHSADSYIESLCEETGYISVWNDAYITGCKPTQQQLNKLKTLKLNGLYHGRIDDIYNKSGVHKDGLGWNACGVFCGECLHDTCEGCKNEHKFFEGFSQEIIDRLKKEIMEDDNEHL